MIINNSQDISVLLVRITYDLSGVNPIILLDNLSEGNDLANVTYWFVVKSPTTTIIHDGSESNPDETGLWSSAVLTDPWPRPFGNIEWSGAPYTFQVFAKDGDGNIFSAPIQSARICRPNGNLPTSTNAYGVGTVLVQTKCDQARIYFQDVSNTSYKGLAGTIGNSVLRVNFPMDNTGTVPAPFEINYFSSAMVPITYSGKGYQFLYTSTWQYDFGNDTFVRIKYLKNDVFGVWCNVDLMPLICEYQKLIDSIENGSCADSEAANRKLMLINPKFSLVVIGIFQPLTGIDVPEVIEEIKAIGGFDCDCCNAATGILPVGSNAFEGYTFSVVPLGGDVAGEFVINGYNVQLQVSDISYIFKICEGSPSGTTAFTVDTEQTGYTKTYCLQVDVDQLAEDILNAIKTDQALVNLFNSIVVSSAGQFNLIVDGKCIFNSSTTYDYEFTLEDIPANTTFGQITGINIDGNVIPLSYSFNMTGLPALQAYLNTLGYGTFTVAASGATTVVITSTNNSTNINALYYASTTSSGLAVAAMVKTGSGFIPLTANQVVQQIIDYLCTIDDSQVITSQAYEICYIDGFGTKQTETIAAGTSLAAFMQSLTERGCTTIDHIISLGSVNCARLKEQFPSSVNVMQANDYFLGTKENACAQILPTEAFLMMLTYGQYDANVLAAFCNMVTLCGGGLPCEPYDVFFALVDGNSPADGDAELVVHFQHPSAVSNTIRYARIDNTVSPVYTTITGILPGQSPYAINGSPGVENGQYRIGIKAIYSDGRACPEVFYDTLPCTGITAFSATYDGTNINVAYTANAGLPFVKVNLTYPNGGSFTQVYANGASIVITPPPEVYGTFFATMQPVCDNDSGWFGAPTAQASFAIPPPYTVIIQVENPAGGNNNKISDIIGITGFTLGAEVTEGNYFGGYHGDFTGIIYVKLFQYGNFSNGLRLYINEVETECIDVSVGTPFEQTKTFASQTFAATDVIRIVFSDTECDASP